MSRASSALKNGTIVDMGVGCSPLVQNCVGVRLARQGTLRADPALRPPHVVNYKVGPRILRACRALAGAAWALSACMLVAERPCFVVSDAFASMQDDPAHVFPACMAAVCVLGAVCQPSGGCRRQQQQRERCHAALPGPPGKCLLSETRLALPSFCGRGTGRHIGEGNKGKRGRRAYSARRGTLASQCVLNRASQPPSMPLGDLETQPACVASMSGQDYHCCSALCLRLEASVPLPLCL